VAVKIKLKRMGKIRVPNYRIVVADSRTKRDGRAIEELGIYQPMEDPSLIRIDSDRVQYWLGVGAQPTEPVLAILKVTGDWQRFKGLPGAEGTLRTAEPRTDKKTMFEAAVKDASAEPKSEATTQRGRAKKVPAKTAAAEAPADAAAAPEAAVAEPAAKPAKAAEPEAKPTKATKAAEPEAKPGKAAEPAAKPAKAAEPPAKPAKATKAAEPAAKPAKATKAAEPSAEARDVSTEASSEG